MYICIFVSTYTHMFIWALHTQRNMESYRTQEAIGNGFIWVLELEVPEKERIFYFLLSYSLVLKLKRIMQTFL